MPLLHKDASKSRKARKVTQPAAQAAQADPPSDADTDAEDTEARAQVQPCQELGPVEAQGGGAQGEALAVYAPPASSGYAIDEYGDGTISRVIFYREGRDPVVQTRPNDDSDDVLLWNLLESSRRDGKRKRELQQTAINKCYALLGPHALLHQGPASARGPNDGTGADTASPQPIKWLAKKLPDRVISAIAGTYRLTIEERVRDCNGKPYVPAQRPDSNGKMQWRGSHLPGKFPHAIMSVKDPGQSHSVRSNQYACVQSNNVQLTVSLRKSTPTAEVPASEAEVLSMISDAYTAPQRARWGCLEGKMLLYVYLEFADGVDAGTPVGANAFNNPPDYGAMFKPPESPPSYLNSDKPGFYEFAMTGGIASITFGFATRVASNNLKRDFRNRLFRLVVKAINPYLVELEGMTAMSSPFLIKGVLHNDTKANERYVKAADGTVVDSGPADVPTN